MSYRPRFKADPDHIAKLKQGVSIWNAWRDNASLEYVELHKGDFRDSSLQFANLFRAVLTKANLEHTDLYRAYLYDADLAFANLRGANLKAALAMEANFCGADLSNAVLVHTNLTGSFLMDADFSGAEMGRTILGDLDLSMCIGLEKVKHIGPSVIGIDTICRSHGRIPEDFLLGAGVPATFVAYARTLADEKTDFESCFISHSTQDQEFVERIYKDLREAGIRCWYAPTDLRIGEPLRQRIQEAIYGHDKVLLILSDAAIRSDWVREEVEACLEREHRQRRFVLFPIQIDDAVMNTKEAWAGPVRQRHIGQFQNWKNNDVYKQAIDRLLHDLQRSSSGSL